jgi:hypothetical protein
VIDKDTLVQQLLELDMEIAAAKSRQRSAVYESPRWEGSPLAPAGATRSQWLRQLCEQRQQLAQAIQRLLDAEDGVRGDE